LVPNTRLPRRFFFPRFVILLSFFFLSTETIFPHGVESCSPFLLPLPRVHVIAIRSPLLSPYFCRSRIERRSFHFPSLCSSSPSAPLPSMERIKFWTFFPDHPRTQTFLPSECTMLPHGRPPRPPGCRVYVKPFSILPSFYRCEDRASHLFHAGHRAFNG